ncbi:hemerythrin domain-containing protein [Nocardioides daeguensis]|uniref:Hemerythrin-like domain-containing protein n=1 Tax=Nocardioides daeguensis TaxID=908359 RepID=A0ABP6VGJ4_9ACTN|nr:hemerythrin domain-containing protein [Nocardioides daeguensis]MBV6729406.1 hemerythrin domain-containing protein [Nocardioides daeguensis]MCR1771821.1 hemerythrin domain-containing protein [Nocardioides daeguensis]
MTDQILLPGQAAAPPGPADMTMMYVLHHAFRRDVHDFRRVVPGLPVEDRAAWRRLAQRWALFTTELHTHHTKEDQILWPLLAERARAGEDVDSLRVLDEMEDEHTTLDPLLTSCDAGFSALAAGAGAGQLGDLRSDLLADLTDLDEALDSHLGHEESAAVPILQRYVPGEEWEVIERERFRGRPSVSHARRFLPWIFKDLDDAAAARVIAIGGPGMRLLLASSRRGFARREAEVFG